jgi:hypothetical protein
VLALTFEHLVTRRVVPRCGWQNVWEVAVWMMHICSYACWSSKGTPYEGNMCYFRRQQPLANEKLQLCEILDTDNARARAMNLRSTGVQGRL